MRWSAWIVPGWVIGVRIRRVWPEGQGPIEGREPGGRGATRYPPNRGAGSLSQTGKERQLSTERDSLKSMRAPSPGRAQVPRLIRPFPVSGSEPSRPPLQGTGTPRPGLGALPAAEVALDRGGDSFCSRRCAVGSRTIEALLGISSPRYEREVGHDRGVLRHATGALAMESRARSPQPCRSVAPVAFPTAPTRCSPGPRVSGTTSWTC
jgi:hypothetical protein